MKRPILLSLAANAFIGVTAFAQTLVPFSLPTLVDTGAGTSASNFAMADFNGDGKLDLITGGTGVEEMGYRQGVGDGNFLREQLINAGLLVRSVGFLAGDYDVDGDVDLCAIEYNANTATSVNLVVYRNNGSAVFTRQNLLSSNGAAAGFIVRSMGDLNGDGRPDLVYRKGYDSIAYALQQSDGSMGSEVVLYTSLNSSASVSPWVADMDNDGALDVVTGDWNASNVGTITVFSNNGAGGFSSSVSFAGGTSASVLKLADMNGDGRMDIVSRQSTAGTRVGYYPQLVGGTFGARVNLITAITAVNSLEVADLNGDGIPDVVAGVGLGGNVLVWSAGLGAGAFGNPVLLDPAQGSSFGVAVGDLDGDGHADFVSMGNSVSRPSPIVVHINKTGENPMQILPPVAPAYVIGDQIEVGVYFGFPITVTGTPRLSLQIGASSVFANYAAGTGTGTLRFRYTVTTTDLDLDGIQLASNLIDLNGGTLTNPIGGAAVLEFPNQIFNTITVNGAGPWAQTITRLDPTPTNAPFVRFQVQFSENVTGVDLADFELKQDAGDLDGSAVTGVTGSGAVYQVTAATGSGSGTLGLSVKSTASINDLAGDPLAKGFIGGQVYTLKRGAPITIDTIYTQNHADYRPIWNNGEITYALDADAGVIGPEVVQMPSNEVLTYAGPNAIVPRPAGTNYDFVGVASGANMYLLPSSPLAGVPYLGFNGLSVPNGIFARYLPADSRISSTNAYMKIQLVAMRSSSGGHASVYSIFSGNPRVWMATSNGIDSTDAFYQTPGGHSHLNVAFSQPGTYELDVFISGYRETNGNTTYDSVTDPYIESGIFTMVFGVDFPGGPANVTLADDLTGRKPLARNDAIGVQPGQTSTGNVLSNDRDPQGQPLTAVLKTGPTNGVLTLNANGSFSYTAHAGFTGSDTFTYWVHDGQGGWTEGTANIFINSPVAFSRAKVAGAGGLGGVSSVNAVDFDADGKLDILAGAYGSNKVVWYRGNGDGSFQNEQVIDAAAQSVWFTLPGDLDMDGDPDALAGMYSGTLAWYQNNGAGVFTRHVLATDISGPNIRIGDLNGDGRNDIFAGQDGGTTLYYFQGQPGGFAARAIISSSFSGIGGIFLHDLDADGDNDLLVGDYFANEISWFMNTGGGVLGPRQFISTQDFGSLDNMSDVNGDGRVDLLSVEYGTSKLSYYAGQAGGGFGARNLLPFASPVYANTAGDLDHDGDHDVVIGAYASTPALAALINQGGGSFGTEQMISLKEGQTGSVRLADLDADGDNDLIVGSFSEGRVAVYLNRLGQSATEVVPPVPGRYLLGQHLDVIIHFGYPVTVTGTPQITLNFGSELITASYVSGSGQTELVFRHVVTAADESAGVQLSSSSIALNGGTIISPSGAAAPLSLPATPFTGVLVNGDLPFVTQITRLDSAVTNAPSVKFLISFNEAVQGVDAADLDIVTTDDLAGVAVLGISGSGSTRVVEVATGTGSGVIALHVKDDAQITDLGGAPIGSGYPGGEVYTLKRQATFTITNFYEAGHGDLRPVYEDNRLELQVHPDGDAYENEEVVITGTPEAAITRPTGAAWDFIGVPAGQNYFRWDATGSIPSLPELGISGEGIPGGTLSAVAVSDPRVNAAGAYFKFQMVAVRSSTGGQVSVFEVDSFGTPTAWMSSADGLSGSDAVWLLQGSHQHFDFGFTAAGTYEVDIVTSGYRDLNGNGVYDASQDPYIESGVETLYLQVGLPGGAAPYVVAAGMAGRAPLAVNDFFSAPAGGVISGNVLTNDSDPQSEVLTALVKTQPTQGALTLNANGSFSYTPTSSTYIGGDSFSYWVHDGTGGWAAATVNLGLTQALTSWRTVHFGSSANTGDAADTADSDRDGIPNLLEYAFDMNPSGSSTHQLPQGGMNGTFFEMSFTQPLGVTGISYGAEYSTTMAPTDWHPVPNSATPPFHLYRVPATGEQKVFMRIQVTTP
jgi:hypothetical protein